MIDPVQSRSKRSAVGNALSNSSWALIFIGVSVAFVLAGSCNRSVSNDETVKQQPRPLLDSQTPIATELVYGNQAAVGRVLIRMRDPKKWQVKHELESQLTKIANESVKVRPVGSSGVNVVRWASGRSIREMVEKLGDRKYSEIIEYVEPDFLVFQDCANPGSGMNPHLDKQWGLDIISACDAWKFDTDPDTIVAVIDSGVDCKFENPNVKCHEDLRGNVWLPPPGFTVRIDGRDTRCAAGCFGFDATIEDEPGNEMRWRPIDNSGHGTGVAGIIAASNNDRGIVGVSFKSKVMAIKYATAGSGFVSSIVRAIDFVIAVSKKEKRLRVVNCSFGFNPKVLEGRGDSETLRLEFQNLNDAGLLIVASNGDGEGIAGSENPHFPSGYPLSNLVAVTSTDPKDGHFPSAYDPQSLNLIGAPGVSIFTTARRNSYENSEGTSFATPYVSGAAALIMSNSKDHCDNLTAAQVRRDILENADSKNTLTRHIMKGRRLNVGAAMKNCARFLADSHH